MKFQLYAQEQERVYLMLPNNFDFTMLPTGSNNFSLKEIGMMSSTIEDIDYSIMSWLKDDLNLSTRKDRSRHTYILPNKTVVPVEW